MSTPLYHIDWQYRPSILPPVSISWYKSSLGSFLSHMSSAMVSTSWMGMNSLWFHVISDQSFPVNPNQSQPESVPPIPSWCEIACAWKNPLVKPWRVSLSHNTSIGQTTKKNNVYIQCMFVERISKMSHSRPAPIDHSHVQFVNGNLGKKVQTNKEPIVYFFFTKLIYFLTSELNN